MVANRLPRRRPARERPPKPQPKKSPSMISRRHSMPRTMIFRSSFALLFGLAVPTAFPAQAAKPSSYTVKKGDTLWEVSRTLLGDPFLWPQIYKLNTDVVEDPHW